VCLVYQVKTSCFFSTHHLLAGGDKSTQSKDIKLARQLAQDLEEEL